MTAYVPTQAYFARGLNLANDPSAAAKSARAIAAELIMLAREKNAFEKAGLNERLSFLLLEQLFAALLGQRKKLAVLQPAIEEFLSRSVRSKQDGQDSAASAAAPAQAGASTTLPIGKQRSANQHGDQDQNGSTCTGDRSKPAVSAAGCGVEDKGAFAIDQLEAASDPAQLRNAVIHYRAKTVMAAHKGAKNSEALSRLYLGRVLCRLGAAEDDVALLQEAARELKRGLEQFDHVGRGVGFRAAATVAGSASQDRMTEAALTELAREDAFGARMALGDALWNLVLLEGGQQSAEQAIAVFEGICSDLSPSRDAAVWARAYCSLGAIYMAQSKGNGDDSLLAKAAEAFAAALRCVSKDGAPLNWASITAQLSSLRGVLAKNSGNLEALAEAAEMKNAAIDLYEAGGDDDSASQQRDQLNMLLEDMQRLGAEVGGAELLPAARFG